MSDITASITELSAALHAKQLSSVELTHSVLDRIAVLNPGLNAFITVNPDRAIAAAKAADLTIAAGRAGPLTGIPIAHKDILATSGMRTTCGSRMLANYTSPFDAHVVEGLARAGTVLIGKTNMDEFAMGSSSETSFFGPVKTPGISTMCRAEAPAAPQPRWRRGSSRAARAPTPAARSANPPRFPASVA